MSGSLDLSLHLWRGVGPDRQAGLFLWRWRLGFLTLTVCRVCVLGAYREAKAEAARLREAMTQALLRVDREKRINEEGR